MCQPNAKIACPFGYEQAGKINGGITGEASQTVNNICIGECSDQCTSDDNYKSFTWSPTPTGASKHAGTCALFSSTTTTDPPSTSSPTSQIACEPLTCAANSHQIGELNGKIKSGTLIPSIYNQPDITTCQTSCTDNPRCVSYSWQPVGGNLNTKYIGQKVCTLYSDWNSDTTVSVGANQIACKNCNVQIKGEPYAFLKGDPHFTMWNKKTHHFSGVYQLQYYLVAECGPQQAVIDAKHANMPFSILGKYYPYSSGNPRPTTLDYVTFILYNPVVEGEGEQQIYYVFLSPDIRSYIQAQPADDGAAPNTLYDKNTDGSLSSFDSSIGEWITLGNTMFKIKANKGKGASDVTFELKIKDEHDCVIKVYMKKQGRNVGSPQRYRMNYMRIYNPECYKCRMCGQFGDFQHTTTQTNMLNCNGESVDLSRITRWKPAANTEAWTAAGLSWEKDYVDCGCTACTWSANAVELPQIDGAELGEEEREVFVEEKSCSPEKKQKIIELCGEAADKSKACCRNIGITFCNELQIECVADICEDSTGIDINQIRENVKSFFTDIVLTECKLKMKLDSIPKLLYEFDGNLEETMSDANTKYALEAFGDAKIGDGVLFCDGDNDYVINRHIIDFDIKSYSLEVLLQIDDISVPGGVMSIDGYKSSKFNSIVFNEDANFEWSIQTNDDMEINSQLSATTESDTFSDEFIHLIATFDSDNKVSTLFRNGVQQKQYVSKKGFIKSKANKGYKIMFCDKYLNSDDNFYGRVRYGAFYDYVLSNEEILMLYNQKIINIVGLDYPIEAIGSELFPGKTLQKAQALMSIDEEYMAVMTQDGNFVVYDIDLEKNIVDTLYEKETLNGEYIKYNTDGSIVIYDKNDEIVLELVSSQSNRQVYVLVMQMDGNLVALDKNQNVYFDINGFTDVDAAKYESYANDFDDIIGGNKNLNVVKILIYSICLFVLVNIGCYVYYVCKNRMSKKK
eukprot:193529_1